MPWKETQKMDQRIEFSLKAMQGGNFRRLCREYGISAKTGYKWVERFEAGGLGGMAERSRRPKSHPQALVEEEICEMVALKVAHEHWGPKKIRELYLRKHGGVAPSESSFKRVLEKAGLVRKRRVRRRTECGRLATGVKAEKPNAVWSVDFKGWWKDREGLRVEPLTVRDEFSRLILEIRLMEDGSTRAVRAVFEQLFERYGLPGTIRSDNGSPFACSRAILGLSQLSVWWVALGIDLERSRPGCPQDNGAHERMHRDIRRELQAGRMGRDQKAFDLWRQEFNHERPHEALGMRMPGEVYQPSERRYEGTPEALDYEGMMTRRVHKSGYIKYEQSMIQLSSALANWDVGLCPTETRVEVWFSNLLLGHIDPQTASFESVRPDRLKAGTNQRNH